MPGAGLLRTLWSWLRRRPRLPSELLAGKAVLEAVDRGGLPLDPARINRIARDLGLEVSPRAPVAETMVRLRAAVERGLQAMDMQDAAKTHKGAKQ